MSSKTKEPTREGKKHISVMTLGEILVKIMAHFGFKEKNRDNTM